MVAAAAQVLLVLDPDPPAVAPGQSIVAGGLVRNQSGRVDNYDVRVTGVPQEWLQVTPETLFLLPFGSSREGSSQERFAIAFTPPREPGARAGTYPCQVEVVSRADQAVVARAPLALAVLVFVRRIQQDVGDLHRIDPVAGAAPVALTSDGRWTSPAASSDGRLAAIHDEQLCFVDATQTDAFTCTPTRDPPSS